MSIKFKKGDNVVVISGSDKGNKGAILKVFPTENKALVSGINKKTKHMKPRPGVTEGGRMQIERKIDLSNLSHIDPKEDKKTKIGFKFLEDGKKVRYAKLSGEVL